MTGIEGADAAVQLHLVDGVAEVVLDLPTAKNSFREAHVGHLMQKLDAVEASPARCLLIRGATTVFSAGWDLQSIDLRAADPLAVINGVVAPLCRRLRNFPLPTVSAVSGPALGFGFGLALSCDICLADADALFGSPFRNIGFVPDTGAHHFLLDRLGYHRAAELIYTGRLLSGREAAELGLINRAVAPGSVRAEARALALDIASGPTQVLRLSKDILLRAAGFDEVLALEAKHQATAFSSADAAEGLRAFAQRRKPVFSGH